MDIESSVSPSTSGAEPRSKVVVSYAKLSNREMLQLLFDHGCKDLSSQINFDACSEFALNGGGYGDIYQGETHEGTSIAVKVMRRSSDIDPKTVKRAIREVYRWSKIQHPNVHELMGVIDFRGQLGMVSLWMENGDLRSYIRKNPELDRYPWCIQVAAGVSYLHASEMIHGDLKASNVLVSSDHIARISDFDCSIISDSSLLFSATGQAPTSLRWAAPELMNSSEEENSTDKTLQSDIYALGMTLLEIVTGDSPYSEYRLDVGVIKAVVLGKLPSRPEVLSEASGKDRVWSLLVQCWSSDRTARPGAQEVLTQLRAEDKPLRSGNIKLIRQNMSVQEIFQELLRHGCVDLSSQINHRDATVTNRGGARDIWKAELHNGAKVAIKSWRRSSLETIDYKSLKRSAREIYIWSRMAHPNIERLMGIIIFRDHQFGMVSEWMECGNLQAYMRQGSYFDRHHMCVQIASALEYIHNCGIVHGDIRCVSD